jgi:hypothetical protein
MTACLVVDASFAVRLILPGAAYDSFYLGLAERLGCELWTADRRLRNAVDLPWVRGID